MAVKAAVSGIAHHERLTLVEHLDELRSRLIVCVSVLAVAFAVCLWQNNALLHILNQPLAQSTATSIKRGQGLPGQIDKNRQALLGTAQTTLALTAVLAGPSSTLPGPTRTLLLEQARRLKGYIAEIPKQTEGNKPVTLRVGEPFSTTLTVSLYFAVLFSLPILLFEIYGFILPAFTPRERKVALPLMWMVPVLFILGVVFGYYVVLPPAVQFLQNFNADSFNQLVQASDYYKFAVLALISLGILFQMPVAILAAVKAGLVTPKQLAKNRRYALLVIAIVAMLLPGTDPVTMLISMVPLILLYEISIVLARMFGRPRPASFDDDDEDGDALGDDEDPEDPHGPAEAQFVTVGGGSDEHDEDDGWDDPPVPRRDGAPEGDVS